MGHGFNTRLIGMRARRCAGQFKGYRKFDQRQGSKGMTWGVGFYEVYMMSSRRAAVAFRYPLGSE